MAQPPLIPMGIYKRLLHNFQYHGSCNVDQGSFILAMSYSQTKNRAVNKTCHHPLLLPDPDLSFNCWDGNPYCLVLFTRFNQTIGFVDNDSMKCPSSKPHTVVPWWPFCTGKPKAYANCTATSPSVQHYPHPNTLMFHKFHLSGGAYWLGHNDHPNVWAWVPVTGWSGHNDLNENQITPLLSGVIYWGLSDIMWLPKEPLYSETLPHLGQHWLFSTHEVVHNQGPLLHTSSIPPWGMHCFPQEGQVLGIYHSCNSQSPSHKHLYLSNQVCQVSVCCDHVQAYNKPAITLPC